MNRCLTRSLNRKALPRRGPLALLIAAASLGLSGPAMSGPAASEQPRQPADAEVRVDHPENFCLGGIEDRKVIVDESRLANPFKQTTRLGCEVDGGDPRTMPDLPTPSPEHRILA